MRLSIPHTHIILETQHLNSRMCYAQVARQAATLRESFQAEPARLNVKFIVLTLSSDVYLYLPDRYANLEHSCGHNLRQAESCIDRCPSGTAEVSTWFRGCFGPVQLLQVHNTTIWAMNSKLVVTYCIVS